MNLTFAGKNVVVVSGDSGRGVHVGRACAVRFAELGAHVVTVDDSEAENAETLKAIVAAGGKGTAFFADTGDEAAMKKVAAQCEAQLTAVHVLVNAHMANKQARFEETPVPEWTRILKINVLGPVVASQVFLPLLKKGGASAITHLGSIDGSLGNPTIPAYSASKGALVPLTHVMAAELGKFGIRVNCVARCAVVGTKLDLKALNAVTPLGRACESREIADVTAFLSSELASYVSGVVLPVDGGRTGVTQGTFA